MSGHKNKGFSQTSKQYDGSLKAQHQQSRNKQSYHSPVDIKSSEDIQHDKNMKSPAASPKK